MKCDELKRKYSDITGPYYGYNEVNEAIEELKARTARSIADEEEMLELGADCPIEPAQVYLKSEADKVIAELYAENERLKAKLESVQATAYADSVDAGMRERRLKRALWLARAENAKNSAFICWNRPEEEWQTKYKKWKKVEQLCRAKAEEYK